MSIRNTMMEAYKEIFGEDYDGKLYFAPGRVNLIGEHTDYNGGYVFPCALSFGTYAMAKKRNDRKLRFYSLNFKNSGIIETSIDELTPLKENEWVAYPKGVIWAFKENKREINCGFDMLVYGDIPSGSGLSSSASLEVLTGAMLRDLYGFTDVSNINLAQWGQYSENNYNGMKCGIMDQFASAMGKKDHAILLNTSNLDYQYTPLVLDGASIVITNTNVKHSLVNSAYNERRMQCQEALKDLQTAIKREHLCDFTPELFEEHKDLIKDPVCRKRAKHAIMENRRTLDAVYALQCNDLVKFGELMNESHASLRDDYEVSCEELDILAEEAIKLKGVYGSRMTGGGFGGCTVSIVKNDAIDNFTKTLANVYKEKTGNIADFYIAETGMGAGIIE